VLAVHHEPGGRRGREGLDDLADRVVAGVDVDLAIAHDGGRTQRVDGPSHGVELAGTEARGDQAGALTGPVFVRGHTLVGEALELQVHTMTLHGHLVILGHVEQVACGTQDVIDTNTLCRRLRRHAHGGQRNSTDGTQLLDRFHDVS